MKILMAIITLLAVASSAYASDQQCGDFHVHAYLGNKIIVRVSKANTSIEANYEGILITKAALSQHPEYADQEDIILDSPDQLPYSIQQRFLPDDSWPQQVSILSAKVVHSPTGSFDYVIDSIQIGDQSLACAPL